MGASEIRYWEGDCGERDSHVSHGRQRRHVRAWLGGVRILHPEGAPHPANYTARNAQSFTRGRSPAPDTPGDPPPRLLRPLPHPPYKRGRRVDAPNLEGPRP